MGKKCSMIIFHHVWNRLNLKKEKIPRRTSFLFFSWRFFSTLRKIIVSLFFFDSVSHLLKHFFFSCVTHFKKSKQSEQKKNSVSCMKISFFPRMFFLKRVIEKREFSVFSPNEKKIFSLISCIIIFLHTLKYWGQKFSIFFSFCATPEKNHQCFLFTHEK